MDTIKIRAGSCKMVAHRGVSGLEKENTMAAFVAAGNRSYYGIETDIHRTLDGHYVAIHDADTGRVARQKLNVGQSTLAELRAICLNDIADGEPRGDLRIPTLQRGASSPWAWIISPAISWKAATDSAAFAPRCRVPPEWFDAIENPA